MPFQPSMRQAARPAPVQEEQVTIWNQNYRAGTAFSVLGTIYIAPEPGKSFPVLKRHARNLLSKHGKGGRLTAAAVPSARAPYTPPPGYKLVKIEEEPVVPEEPVEVEEELEIEIEEEPVESAPKSGRKKKKPVTQEISTVDELAGILDGLED